MQIKETLGLTNKSVEERGRAGATDRAGDKAATVSGAVAATTASDRVELSGRSRDMAKAAQTLAGTPEVRESRVAHLGWSIFSLANFSMEDGERKAGWRTKPAAG